MSVMAITLLRVLTAPRKYWNSSSRISFLLVLGISISAVRCAESCESVSAAAMRSSFERRSPSARVATYSPG